jgi:hypothetical protein
MAGYAALGVGYAAFTLVMYVAFSYLYVCADLPCLCSRGIALGCLTYESSKHLHRKALNQVFHAPVSISTGATS